MTSPLELWYEGKEPKSSGEVPSRDYVADFLHAIHSPNEPATEKVEDDE